MKRISGNYWADSPVINPEISRPLTVFYDFITKYLFRKL